MTFQEFADKVERGEQFEMTLKNILHALRFCLVTWLKTPRERP